MLILVHLMVQALSRRQTHPHGTHQDIHTQTTENIPPCYTITAWVAPKHIAYFWYNSRAHRAVTPCMYVDFLKQQQHRQIHDESKKTPSRSAAVIISCLQLIFVFVFTSFLLRRQKLIDDEDTAERNLNKQDDTIVARQPLADQQLFDASVRKKFKVTNI